MQRSNQSGFTIVQAIFILVVLAMLGTYMVSLSTVGQATSTQALLQARAYQAARAGLEWGIAATLKSSQPWDGYSETIEDYGNFTIIVTRDIDSDNVVDDVSYNEAGTTVYIYPIKAVATYADISSPDYVSRTLEVTIHD